jgi:hypothetical protein
MTMTFGEPTTTATVQLTLTPIGAGEWLIHDERFGRADPRCLVAFIREDPGADVEVVWLGRISPAGAFANADAVLAAAVAASS